MDISQHFSFSFPYGQDSMDDLAKYDPDGDTDRYLQFPNPPLDPLSYLQPLASQFETFPPSPLPPSNNNIGLTTNQVAAPVQGNVPSEEFNITESLIRELGVLTNDCCEWFINPLGKMVYHIPCVGEVHLEVYGSHGIFQHGLICLQNHLQGSPPQTIAYTNLSDKNYDWVKNFIDKYRMLMENHAGEWKTDTLSHLVMGSAVGSSSRSSESYLSPQPDFVGSSQLRAGYTTGTSPGTETEGSGARTRPRKTGLAAQRERINNMTSADVAPYFHLPRELAARELNLSVSTLKKVCRKWGIKSWPYSHKV